MQAGLPHHLPALTNHSAGARQCTSATCDLQPGFAAKLTQACRRPQTPASWIAAVCCISISRQLHATATLMHLSFADYVRLLNLQVKLHARTKQVKAEWNKRVLSRWHKRLISHALSVKMNMTEETFSVQKQVKQQRVLIPQYHAKIIRTGHTHTRPILQLILNHHYW